MQQRVNKYTNQDFNIVAFRSLLTTIMDAAHIYYYLSLQ